MKREKYTGIPKLSLDKRMRRGVIKQISSPVSQRFIPPFREYHINIGYLFLIDGIFILNRPRRLNEFNKISDGSPVRRIQNFVWIEDINYE
ncbi:MAG: hypothetical protein GF353_01620 [Candidatus Lokiarchaeota archaeon]|nr:hypothetical protein [Candidatus Lokiarchaeota archaeon]